MTGYINAAAIVGATVTALTYVHLNFASASDFVELKQIIIAENIQDRMWRACDTSNNSELLRRIEAERAEFKAEFGQTVEWVCKVP